MALRIDRAGPMDGYQGTFASVGAAHPRRTMAGKGGKGALAVPVLLDRVGPTAGRGRGLRVRCVPMEQPPPASKPATDRRWRFALLVILTLLAGSFLIAQLYQVAA